MIYFLQDPTGRVSIRYYRTRGLFDAALRGEAILLIKRGSRKTLSEFEERFSAYRGISTGYHIAGDLRRFLFIGKHGNYLLAKDIAKKYAITKKRARKAMRQIDSAMRVSASHIRNVYEAERLLH